MADQTEIPLYFVIFVCTILFTIFYSSHIDLKKPVQEVNALRQTSKIIDALISMKLVGVIRF